MEIHEWAYDFCENLLYQNLEIDEEEVKKEN